MQITVNRVLDKDVMNAIAVLTFPTKLETAEHFPVHFYINCNNVLAYRVFKADVSKEHQDKLVRIVTKKLAS